MSRAKFQNPDSPPKSRLRLGGAIFILGQCAPLGIPFVVGSGLPIGWKNFLSALLLFGIPEAGILVSIVILGKSGFNYLRGLVFGSIRRYALPQTVSRPRYRLGLVLFLLPLIYGWLSPYLPLLLHGYEPTRFWAFVGDLLLFVSLFLLGGDFWDKLRALFVWEERVAKIDTDEGQSSLSVKITPK
ncbi:MAG: hypothetical protein WBM44_06495 [Waterburya sp.]